MAERSLTLWRIELRLRGPTLSAWQADTIWGHLCWALLRQEGEAALEGWLGRYRRGDPPLFLSDGFPGSSLPVPILPVALDSDPPASGPSAAEDRKRLKMTRWLTRPDFLAALRTGRIEPCQQAEEWVQQTIWKNTISRTMGSSLREEGSGGLFALRERWPPGGRITVYARVADPDRPLAQALFRSLIESGFGKRRAVGYGNVTEVEWGREIELETAPPAANGFVTLSSFVPRTADPVHGAWDLRAKHARFSDEMAGPPWKQSLLFLATGSSFYTQTMRDWYGGLVERIAVDSSTPARRNAVQYGYAFPIPATLPGERPMGTPVEGGSAWQETQAGDGGEQARGSKVIEPHA